MNRDARKRYVNHGMQLIYETMLRLAADEDSELYLNSEPRRGAAHRAAFWDGYSGKYTLRGPNRSPHVAPMTLSHACFMAGREWARLKQPA